jgi:transcriptional/translational regulatory protein YebC/TACO1
MSGHSKWATTKHKKAVIDSRRGKLFAKLIKNVEVAARTGGADVSGNPTLADAIAKAKGSSVPNENIDRAVKRGAGLEAGGADWEPITYEGYGPGGVAMLVECLTDNRNRAASEVRTAMTRGGGNLADPGSVLDAGAQEVNDLDDSFEVISEATDLAAVRAALKAAGIEYESAEISWLPSVSVQLEDDVARKVLRLVEALEDCDDVQNVYANFDISDDVLAEA